MDRQKTPAVAPRLLSFSTASAQLSISRRTLERLVARAEIRAVKVGRRRLIESAELARFIDSRAQTQG